MVIEVPISNLKGAYDNGFAHISPYSEHPSEKEVLVNIFNVFKILSFYSTMADDGKVIYIVHLEYGSLKPVEEKVKKSEMLLDAEFVHIKNIEEY